MLRVFIKFQIDAVNHGTLTELTMFTSNTLYIKKIGLFYRCVSGTVILWELLFLTQSCLRFIAMLNRRLIYAEYIFVIKLKVDKIRFNLHRVSIVVKICHRMLKIKQILVYSIFIIKKPVKDIILS